MIRTDKSKCLSTGMIRMLTLAFLTDLLCVLNTVNCTATQSRMTYNVKTSSVYSNTAIYVSSNEKVGTIFSSSTTANITKNITASESSVTVGKTVKGSGPSVTPTLMVSNMYMRKSSTFSISHTTILTSIQPVGSRQTASSFSAMKNKTTNFTSSFQAETNKLSASFSNIAAAPIWTSTTSLISFTTSEAMSQRYSSNLPHVGVSITNSSLNVAAPSTVSTLPTISNITNQASSNSTRIINLSNVSLTLNKVNGTTSSSITTQSFSLKHTVMTTSFVTNANLTTPNSSLISSMVRKTSVLNHTLTTNISSTTEVGTSAQNRSVFLSLSHSNTTLTSTILTFPGTNKTFPVTTPTPSTSTKNRSIFLSLSSSNATETSTVWLFSNTSSLITTPASSTSTQTGSILQGTPQFSATTVNITSSANRRPNTTLKVYDKSTNIDHFNRTLSLSSTNLTRTTKLLESPARTNMTSVKDNITSSYQHSNITLTLTPELSTASFTSPITIRTAPYTINASPNPSTDSSTAQRPFNKTIVTSNTTHKLGTIVGTTAFAMSRDHSSSKLATRSSIMVMETNSSTMASKNLTVLTSTVKNFTSPFHLNITETLIISTLSTTNTTSAVTKTNLISPSYSSKTKPYLSSITEVRYTQSGYSKTSSLNFTMFPSSNLTVASLRSPKNTMMQRNSETMVAVNFSIKTPTASMSAIVSSTIPLSVKRLPSTNTPKLNMTASISGKSEVNTSHPGSIMRTVSPTIVTVSNISSVLPLLSSTVMPSHLVSLNKSSMQSQQTHSSASFRVTSQEPPASAIISSSKILPSPQFSTSNNATVSINSSQNMLPQSISRVKTVNLKSSSVLTSNYTTVVHNNSEKSSTSPRLDLLAVTATANTSARLTMAISSTTLPLTTNVSIVTSKNLSADVSKLHTAQPTVNLCETSTQHPGSTVITDTNMITTMSNIFSTPFSPNLTVSSTDLATSSKFNNASVQKPSMNMSTDTIRSQEFTMSRLISPSEISPSPWLPSSYNATYRGSVSRNSSQQSRSSVVTGKNGSVLTTSMTAMQYNSETTISTSHKSGITTTFDFFVEPTLMSIPSTLLSLTTHGSNSSPFYVIKPTANYSRMSLLSSLTHTVPITKLTMTKISSFPLPTSTVIFSQLHASSRSSNFSILPTSSSVYSLVSQGSSISTISPILPSVSLVNITAASASSRQVDFQQSFVSASSETSKNSSVLNVATMQISATTTVNRSSIFRMQSFTNLMTISSLSRLHTKSEKISDHTNTLFLSSPSVIATSDYSSMLRIINSSSTELQLTATLSTSYLGNVSESLNIAPSFSVSPSFTGSSKKTLVLSTMTMQQSTPQSYKQTRSTYLSLGSISISSSSPSPIPIPIPIPSSKRGSGMNVMSSTSLIPTQTLSSPYVHKNSTTSLIFTVITLGSSTTSHKNNLPSNSQSDSTNFIHTFSLPATSQSYSETISTSLNRIVTPISSSTALTTSSEKSLKETIITRTDLPQSTTLSKVYMDTAISRTSQVQPSQSRMSTLLSSQEQRNSREPSNTFTKILPTTTQAKLQTASSKLSHTSALRSLSQKTSSLSDRISSSELPTSTSQIYLKTITTSSTSSSSVLIAYSKESSSVNKQSSTDVARSTRVQESSSFVLTVTGNLGSSLSSTSYIATTGTSRSSDSEGFSSPLVKITSKTISSLNTPTATKLSTSITVVSFMTTFQPVRTTESPVETPRLSSSMPKIISSQSRVSVISSTESSGKINSTQSRVSAMISSSESSKKIPSSQSRVSAMISSTESSEKITSSQSRVSAMISSTESSEKITSSQSRVSTMISFTESSILSASTDSEIGTIASTELFNSPSSSVGKVTTKNTPTATKLSTSSTVVSVMTTFQPVRSLSSSMSKITSSHGLVTGMISSSESSKKITSSQSGASAIISSPESSISSAVIGTIASTEIFNSPSGSAGKVTTKTMKLFKVSSFSETVIRTASLVISSESSSCASCIDTKSVSTVPTVTPVAVEFKVEVILLIRIIETIDATFIEKLRESLQKFFNLGLKLTSSRKRRALVEKMLPLKNNAGFIKKYLDTSMDVGKDRVRRQTTEPRVEILNVTRKPGSEEVKVTFYVVRGNTTLPSAQTAKIMNTPSKADQVAILGYQVSGEFSSVKLDEKTTKKKTDETLLIVLAVCIPVLFVFGACIFIKCKKKPRHSQKIKLNKVSIEQPKHKDLNVPESVNEERYTRAPTLPMKDYPDVIIQTPARRKQRTKKEKKPTMPRTETEALSTLPPAPAATFENITRVSFDGPSNVAIDDVPLRLRPAVRQDNESPKPEPVTEDPDVPLSWKKGKNIVDTKIKKDDSRQEEKLASDKSFSTPTTRDVTEDGEDSDDTIQIKANIEKWRNKMRQREKRKERREERKRLEKDKLIALEEKKLSRREWLMAQPEIQAILDGEDLSKPASTRKKKYRKKRESRKHLDSENDEVMVAPVRRPHHRSWTQRSVRRVYPSERDGVRLIAVRPKKPRMYAFEQPGPEEEFEPRYIRPEENNVPLSRPTESATSEAEQFRDDYSYSPDSVYDEEFYDPFVPEYGELRYYEPPRRVEYIMTQTPETLEQQLPLRMQETSFIGTPREPYRPTHPRQIPRGMYYEQQPPRPSKLYSQVKKSPTIPEETEHTSGKSAPQSGNTTPRATGDNTPSPAKSADTLSHNISPGQSFDSKTDEDFKNYSINENEARKLVSRVLERAKSEADKT